jgi:hypothetical protein
MLTGPFAKILEDQRSRFNAKFAEARRFRPKLDPNTFLDHLHTTVAPVVEAVSGTAPDRAAEVADVLYDLSLDLLGQELLGPHSRYPAIREAWTHLLPRLPQSVAAAPREFVGSVTNALYQLSLEPGARPGEWMGGLLGLEPLCPDVATLLRAGQVLAWRAGLAHYRLSALEICRRLDPRVAAAALGLPSEASQPPLDKLLDALIADPWRRPDFDFQPRSARLQIMARAGAFRGFGGLFIAPPTVGLAPPNAGWADDHIVVSDGASRWLLFADRFGVTFQRTELQPQRARSSRNGFQADVTGAVRKDGHQQIFPELANLASAASTPTTLAAATSLSHAIYLIALVEEERR